MAYYVKAKTYLLEDGPRSGGYLSIENGRFNGFVDTVLAGVSVKDFGECTIAPGLFDTHIHGVNGYDIMDGTVEAVQGISEAILKFGVTRFLPTSLTSSKVALEKAIQAVKAAVDQGLAGAESEGIFLEGPFFTEKYKGAQNPIHFSDPNLADFTYWQDLAGGHIKKIALAPERDGSMDFIKKVTKSGVKVGIAHTDASYDCCQDAVEHGANIFVHLFNGMSGLHHRNPGVAGAALINEHAYAEIICDGHHVHPDVAAMAYERKKDKLMLITDCMRAGLLPDGNYMLGEFDVTMKDGIARMENGALAGSTLTLIDGVKNLTSWSMDDLYKVWHKASLSPAKSLDLGEELGSIAIGKKADFVVLNESLDVEATAVSGEIKYERK